MLTLTLLASFAATPVPAPQPIAAPGTGVARQNVVATAVADGRFTTLTALVSQAGLVPALDGSTTPQRWTVFAPTDAAFAALPASLVQQLQNDVDLLTQVLTYHVLASGTLAADVIASPFLTTLNTQRLDVELVGTDLFIDDSEVIQGNVLCTNGVIHVIDRVLLPNTLDLVGTAVDAGTFNHLAQALTTASLVAPLTAPGPFTVFAPTDSAFDALPPTVKNRLLIPGPNTRILSDVLKYHVVPGRLYAADVVAAGQLTTLLGQDLPVTVVGSDVFVDGVRIVAADVETTNGNIHVLENVLIP